MRLSDTIQSFIKEMLNDQQTEVELKRNELAEYFNCAPSQINYVLATRFSPASGYLTESRRGGGGYIRVVRIVQEGPQQLLQLLLQQIGDSIEENDAVRVILQLLDRELITPAEGEMMRAAILNSTLGVPMPQAMKDVMRARILRSMLLALARTRRNAT